jgi:hypothetical protein
MRPPSHQSDNQIIINLLFIAAGNVSVVWERFLLQDCVIEHRFVSGEKPRERKIDSRRQRELYSKRYGSIRKDRNFRLSHRDGNSRKRPTHPEKVCNIEKARADAHVYIRVYAIDESRHRWRHRDYHCGGGAPVLRTSLRDRTHDPHLERKTYNSICIPVPSMRLIHRGNIDMCTMYEPILVGNKSAISFDSRL